MKSENIINDMFMKRLLTMAAMFLCCMTTTFAQFSGSGSGTESDPYLILNPIQLNQLRNYLNQSGVYFKLMADIDLTEFIEDEYSSQGWQPVGTSSTPFKGILDGNGKTVSGIKISRGGSDYVGFFGNLDGGTVKNLTLTGGTVNGGNYVGFMSGNGGTVLDCTIAGKVNGVKGDGYTYVGGCVGYGGNCTRVKSTVDVCGYNYVGGICGANGAFNECTVTNNYVEGNNFVGGICGLNNLGSYYDDNKSPMKDCHVNTLRIVGGDYVGGICGQIKNKGYTIRIVDVENCCFIGEINANSYVGGVCGEYTGIGKMKRCFGIGNISVNQNYGGGLIGFSESGYGPNDANDITNSYFSGSINGKEMIGGLIGYKYNGTVKYCYTNVNVNGTRNVGGLFGKIEGYASSNYYRINLLSNVAIATYVKATEGNVGRIYGLAGNNVNVGEMGTANENKAWNRAIVINAGVAQDIADDAQNGSGVSKTTLKLKATYVAMGFDFNDTWEIQETECYPYMKMQTAPPVITSQLVSGVTTISGKCVDGGTVTLEVDGVTQQMVSTGHEFSFNVSPLQAGHEVRISAKTEGKEQSYYTTEVVSYLGKGTEDDPYQVYTASDLTGVYRKGYFKLMNDIDLTSYINQFSSSEGWESIGREGSETIHFDGNGHKITGLWCNSTRDNTGLFSCFANGTIKNLTVETAKNKQVKGGANTGILIGKMINGTIENCRVSGSVADGTPVGGMVGLFDGGKISLSQANVTINTTLGTSYVGGLVGEITSGEIDQCVTLGNLTASGKESYVGGLVGKNSAIVTNCYSNANVTSTYNAAGLIAYNYGIIDKCYATGNIFSSNFGAGVIGYNDGENAIIKNCVAMNNKIDVTWESQQEQQSGGYGQRIIGGIKNGAPAPELNNYALKTMQVSLNDVPQRVYDDIMNGVGKNGSDLVKGSTYQELGWDFSAIWTITEGESYPSLKNNAANVLKPGEDPEPEPEPEPVLSKDDQIVVGEVSANKGKSTTLSIGLDNKTTTLSAYQFDLKLPAGFTLSKNDKGKFQVSKTNRYEDEAQTLNVSAVEGSINTYRFICFSLSNSVIEGTSGTILNAIIDAADTMEPGNYEGQISNIVFTKADGTQVKLNSLKFIIEVNNVIKGDANDDGEINVADIVEIVNYILDKPSTRFVMAAADLNNDGEVNVTDIVNVVSIIMSANGNQTRMRAPQTEMTDNDQLLLTSNGNQYLSLCLENEGDYIASQFELVLSADQTLESVNLNSSRTDNHILNYTKIGENRYKVVIYSLNNSIYNGHSGELLTFKVSGSGNVMIENILFITSGQTEKRFLPLYGGTTGINVAESQADLLDIYSIDGRLIRKQVKTMDELEKGLYIINGRKHIVR